MPSDPEPGPELLASRVLHEGRIFRLIAERVRLPSGRVQDVDVVEHPGAVAVAARDATGRLAVVRQYRHAVGASTLEIPAGRLDPGEEPLDAAKRELEEETGLRARRWQALGSFLPIPGYGSERIHLFLAEELEAAGGERLAADEDEELELSWHSPAELAGGGSEDGKTLIAVAILAGGLPRVGAP